jgi:hypothetical protein
MLRPARGSGGLPTSYGGGGSAGYGGNGGQPGYGGGGGAGDNGNYSGGSSDYGGYQGNSYGGYNGGATTSPTSRSGYGNNSFKDKPLRRGGSDPMTVFLDKLKQPWVWGAVSSFLLFIMMMQYRSHCKVILHEFNAKSMKDVVKTYQKLKEDKNRLERDMHDKHSTSRSSAQRIAVRVASKVRTSRQEKRGSTNGGTRGSLEETGFCFAKRHG